MERESEWHVVRKRGSGWKKSSINFFFTNFPLEYQEEDMWRVFQRWGRVVDMFISRRLNNKNQRFGFVKFQDVVDAVDLERRLDSVWIGYWKVRVNSLKYGRDREPWHVRNANPKLKVSRTIVQRKKGNVEPNVNQSHNVWKEKLSNSSIVENGGNGEKRMKNPIAFKAEVQQYEWLDNCFIGRTVEPSMAKDMKKSFILGGFKFIRVRFWEVIVYCYLEKTPF